MKRTSVARLFAGLLLLLSGAVPLLAYTVSNTNDAGPGSLRDALGSQDSFINFAPAVFSMPQTILLQSRLPSINRDLVVDGPGANLLTVDGTSHVNDDALFTIFNTSPVVLFEGFKIAHGNSTPGEVGGMFSRSTNLTLENMVFADNQGIGLFNQGGKVTILASTVSGNTGVGLFNQGGTAYVENSTIAMNSREGIVNQAGNLTIQNSTIAGNLATGVSSGTIFGMTTRSLEIESSILANNAANDLSYDSYVFIHNSLIESTSGVANGVDGNVIGIDPLLGPLGLNGGTTATMLPLPGSPAINAGSNPLALSADQRGFNRVVGGQIDIGAVETVPEPATLSLLLIGTFATACGRKRYVCGSPSRAQD